MKKISTLATVFVIAVFAVSCAKTPTSGSINSDTNSASNSASSKIETPVKVVTAIDVAIDLQFDYAEDFSDDLALIGTNVSADGAAKKYAYIDFDGKTVIELDESINFASSFKNGIAMVARAKSANVSEMNFIDKKGNILLEDWVQDERRNNTDGGASTVTRILTLTGSTQNFAGLAQYNVFYGDKGVALFDKALTPVINYGVYSGMFWAPDTDFAIVSSLEATADGAYLQGVVNVDGSELAPAQYTSVQSISGVGFKLNGEVNAGCTLLLYDGTIVQPRNYTAFDFIALEDKNALIFSAFDKNGEERWGVMDKAGEILVEPTFAERREITGYELSLDIDIAETKTATPPKNMVTLWQDENYQIFATDEQYNAAHEIEPEVKVGIAKLNGDILVKAQHEAISAIHEGVYKLSESLIADSSSGWKQYSIAYYVLTSADGSIKSPTYYSMGNLSQNMVAVSDGTKYGFLCVKY